MFKVTTKLAVSNLLKNKQLYLPFALANCLSIIILYIFITLANNDTILNLYSGKAIQLTLTLGIYVVGIASVIIVVYANNFVMKNRTKELGLYSVLGLEKRHLHLMLFLELVIFAVITSTLGIMLGALLDKLAFAFLMKVMQFPVQIVQGFHWTNVILTLTIFMGVYALILLLNIVRIHRLKPIELLKESKKGEKHSRFLMLQTLIGLSLLGFGYYLAQTVSRPIKSLPIFFTAVLFVVAATYILFTAGSITLLTFLKKKKSYYYQPQNFISVSNLIFRMRKNAVGLATICLLSTMALVTTVGGTALFIGTENYVKMQAPHALGMTIYREDDSIVKQKTKDLESMAQSLDIDLQPAVSIKYVELVGNMNNSEFILDTSPNYDPSTEIKIIDNETYNQLTGESLTLDDNEILIYSSNTLTLDSFSMFGQTWRVHKQLSEDFLTNKLPSFTQTIIPHTQYIVVSTFKVLDTIDSDILGYSHYIGFNSNSKQETQIQLSEEWTDHSIQLVSYANLNKLTREVIGSAFFIGVFLSILFVSGMILVIYYKQLSEGYEDRSRFEILQKVGLDRKMIRQTVRRQMLSVFFIPIIMAIIHLGFAYKNLGLILQMFGIDMQVMLPVTINTTLLFSSIYILVYWLTSKQYEHIISA